jgi:hypothetical protein
MPRRLAAELAARIAAENWYETVRRLTLFALFCLSRRRPKDANGDAAHELVFNAVKEVLEGEEVDTGRSLIIVLCERIRRDVG